MSNSHPEWKRRDEPPSLGDVLHIDRVPAGAYMTGDVISSKMEGWDTHWFQKRTRPCIGPKNGCFCATTLLSTRWVGFIQWWRSGYSAPTLLELTQLGGLRLKSLVEKFGRLRGLRIEVKRERTDKRSPIVISVIGDSHEPEKLPSPKPLGPTLERLWGNAHA